MQAGFFDTSDMAVRRAPPPLLPKCGACGLYKHCHSPKIALDGDGQRKILVLGEAPGFREDEIGYPFVGASGKLLTERLSQVGIDLRRDCWIYNSVICRPTTPEGKNRTPTPQEISYCQPNVIRTVTELKPEIILLLGGVAITSLLGWLWKEDLGMAGRWDGWRIPHQKLNAWICPTWHPAALLHADHGQRKHEAGLRRLFFDRHLEAAAALRGRPWRQVPDFASRCEAVTDPVIAAERLRAMLRRSRANGCTPIAFDYENSPLKPDRLDAEIICCSVSDGVETFAYPWHGPAITATEELILCVEIGKIASNEKHEERWSYKEYGHGVRNWLWDTMLAAHTLDSRRQITSIKFQAFVHLGQDDWAAHVHPYLTAKTSNSHNRIKEVPLPTLLKYCAMDALMEWKIARIQMRQMGLWKWD